MILFDMGETFKDYNPTNGKVSFFTSLALHTIVFGGAFLFAYLGDIFKSEQKAEVAPFTLVPTPDAPNVDSPEPPSEQIQDIKVKDIADIKPIELPQPEPDPEPDPSPDPKPDPKPEPKSQPDKKATVSASDNAKPPAKRITKADFDKRNPKNRRPSQVKNTAPVKSVDFNSIKLDSSKVKFSVPKSSKGAGVPSSAVNSYAAYIQRKTDSAWIIPPECAGLPISVKLNLLISPYGKVLKAKRIGSSGNAAFDESVERIFKNISFNPPPGGEEFNVTITFVREDGAR